jgi:hypothetical protein
MGERERLSLAVSGILEFENLINVDQKDIQVVAYSFGEPDEIRPTWELAIKAASELLPSLKDDDAHQGDWSMNLFTLEGLWEFPEIPAEQPNSPGGENRFAASR